MALAEQNRPIGYEPGQSHPRREKVWLPLAREVEWSRGGGRYYGRHTFSNVKVFEVQYAQQIQAPKASYCFNNTSERDIAGIFTVSPVSGIATKPVSIRLTIPAGRDVCKLVGLGKDVSMPADAVGSATFIHDGSAGSITVDASLVKESTLDLIPETDVAAVPP